MNASIKCGIHRLLFSIVTVAVMASILPSAYAEKILYVQRSQLRDTVKFINILKAQGHDLTIHDDATQGATDTAANYASQGFELLIADEVIGSGSVGDRWRHSTVPVINWEGFLYNDPRSDFNGGAVGTDMIGNSYADAATAMADNGGAGADYGQVNGLTNVTIVDASHPLAAGFSAGDLAIWDFTGNEVTTFVGTRTLISGAQVVATIPGWSGGAAIMGVPEGVTNADGTTNMARWVHLPWNDSEDVRVVSENGFFLYEAAVAWALGKPEPTKIRNLTPDGGAFLPTNTPISFSVDKQTAAGSAVATSGIELLINGTDVTGDATITDGGSTWDVLYEVPLPKNKAFTVIARATAADGGFSARLAQIDTIDESNFTFEAEDFNFGGGMFFDDPVLCRDFGGTTDKCYFDRVGFTNIDQLEIDFVTTADDTDVYRFGSDPFTREEYVDTYITGDTLVRTEYVQAGFPESEVRNIATGEWLNYTRSYPTGLYNVYVRVSSPGAFQAQVDLVDNATTTNQNLTKVGRFVVPSGTAGYTLVPLTDDAGNTPITVEFTSTTPSTLRVTALSGGWRPNFYMLIPTEAPVNQPPTASITSPADYSTGTEGQAITVDIDASDDGSITNVQVLAAPTGGTLTLVGEDNTAPYSVSFTPPNLGTITTYTIRAVATDDGGLSGQDDITVKVTDPSLVVVTTGDGVGADAEVGERPGEDRGSTTGASVNTRFNANDRNEVIALKFDLGANDASVAADAAINMVSFRGLDAHDLRVYAVIDGTTGLDNNILTPGFTDNTWDESANTVGSTMPGFVWDGDSTTKGFTNVVDLGVVNMGGGEGDIWTFSSDALNTFLQTNTDNIVTFLIDCETESGGQKRFATKEATALNSGTPVVPLGWYAPTLVFRTPAATITIDSFSLAGDQLTLNWTGGTGPYTVQKKSPITADWMDEQTGINDTTATVTIDDGEGYYRVVGP